MRVGAATSTPQVGPADVVLEVGCADGIASHGRAAANSLPYTVPPPRHS